MEEEESLSESAQLTNSTVERSSKSLTQEASYGSGRQATMNQGVRGSSDQMQTSAAEDDEGPKPDDLTKKYLQLLNSGRLASKKKSEVQTGHTRSMSPGGGGSTSSAGAAIVADMQARSVYETDLQKLHATAAGMDVIPVGRASRPSSSLVNAAGGGAGSPRRHPRLEEKATVRQSFSAPSSFRVANLATTPAAPFHKVYTPGPGAYRPGTDRFGHRDGSKYSFGTARQRPPHVCIHDNVVSPGPVYMPHKEFVSTLASPSKLTFGRQDMGSRFSLNASQPSNCPHWNPGPGDYDSLSVYTGGKTDAGADVPKTVFGKVQKLIRPEDRFAATVFISEGHSKRENGAVHSPGPCNYSPDEVLTRKAASRYSLAAKAPSYFDAFLDPTRQPSPGPIYSASNPTHHGTKTWGDEPKTAFGRAKKQWEPEVNLGATAHISNAHALHSNQSLHSPGPVYYPEVKDRVKTMQFNSGQADRFYDRFEQGRVG